MSADRGIRVVVSEDGRCPFCKLKLGPDKIGYHLCNKAPREKPKIRIESPRVFYRLPSTDHPWVDSFAADPWDKGETPRFWRGLDGKLYKLGENCWETRAEAVRELWRRNYSRLRRARADLMEMGRRYGHGNRTIARNLPNLNERR
jgi:hypothetical protein